MIELLAPAGNLEKAKISLMYGADAVYVGGKSFSLRARASNFSVLEIKELVEFAHKLNKKVYVTMNIIPHDSDFSGLDEYLKDLEKVNIDTLKAYYQKLINNGVKCILFDLDNTLVPFYEELPYEKTKNFINYLKNVGYIIAGIFITTIIITLLNYFGILSGITTSVREKLMLDAIARAEK